MKAIVCDMCGAVMLLEDGKEKADMNRMYIVETNFSGDVLDLCEDCGKAIIEKAREIRTSVKMEG